MTMKITIPGRPRKPHGCRPTSEILVEAAEIRFAAQGYDGARLEDVAADVKIRRSSVLHHFPSKKALYDAVEARIFRDMHRAVEAATANVSSALDRLHAHLDAWLDFFVSRPAAARIVLRLSADSAVRGDNPVEYSNLALEDMEATVHAGIVAGAFPPLSPMLLINAVASGILHYVCNGQQLGGLRLYDPADEEELQAFRSLLHRIATAAVLPHAVAVEGPQPVR